MSIICHAQSAIIGSIESYQFNKTYKELDHD